MKKEPSLSELVFYQEGKCDGLKEGWLMAITEVEAAFRGEWDPQKGYQAPAVVDGDLLRKKLQEMRDMMNGIVK